MKSVNIKFDLPVVFLKEKGAFIAYSPALDLSTSGKSIVEAQKRFAEISSIFLREIMNKGTVDEVLSDLGWEKVKSNWNPPLLISHSNKTIQVPVCA
jgi:hypothetical protein